MNSRERFLAACYCRPVDKTPIWIMRQAGRYLPEYRELKSKYSFLELVQTPELAAEVTLQPLSRFPLDAAIIFSDILVIPEAMGQGYHFREEGGIGMDFAISNANDITKLSCDSIDEKLCYTPAAMRLVRSEIGNEMALLGFSGSPWTLATYMVEGGSSKNFSRIKNLFFEAPDHFEALLEKITQAVIRYMQMQIEAGADALQIFDSWASACPGNAYESMSLRWIKRIIDALPKTTPIILFAKGMHHHTTALTNTGAQILGIDWTVDLGSYRKTLDENIAIQGNLDPTILDGDSSTVRSEAKKILGSLKGQNGHIFNLGHGIHPSAKIENVETLVETVHTY